MSARDRRPRVIWASRRLTLAQKALWDLIRRLESPSRGDGAFGSADYLAECLGLAERTVMTDRGAMHRAGLLEARQPRGRRQLALWFALLPSECEPANAAQGTILLCAKRLDTYLATLSDFGARVRPEAHSESGESTPDSALSRVLPPAHSGVLPPAHSSTREGMGWGNSLIPSSSQDEGIRQHAAPEGRGGAADEGTRAALPEAAPLASEVALALRELEDSYTREQLLHLVDEARRAGNLPQVEKLQAALLRRPSPQLEGAA